MLVFGAEEGADAGLEGGGVVEVSASGWDFAEEGAVGCAGLDLGHFENCLWW